MLRYCYACDTTHDKNAPCPQQTSWSGPKVARIRQRIYQRDGGTCQECGRTITLRDSHVDHITPRIIGGTDHDSNLRLTCIDCNLTKGAA